MNRMIAWGVGAAWAAAPFAAAAEPAFVDLSNLQNLTAAPAAPVQHTTAAPTGLPVTPTVPAPYASELAAHPGAVPMAVETGGCAPAGCAPGHRGPLGERLKGWICYKPGPAVLPQWNPDPGFPPLMAYFPCKPLGGSGCGRTDGAPAAVVLNPGNSLSLFRGSVRTAPVPLIGSPEPIDPPSKPTDTAAPKVDAPDDKADPKDKDAEKKPREMLYQAPPRAVPAAPFQAIPASRPLPPVQGPRLVPVGPAGTTAPPLPGTTSTRSPGVFDRISSVFGGSSDPAPAEGFVYPVTPAAGTPTGPVVPASNWGYPLLPAAPVAQPAPAAPKKRAITARGAAPSDAPEAAKPAPGVVPAGGPTASGGGVKPVSHPGTVATGCPDGTCSDAGGDGVWGLFPCKVNPMGNVRCLGHGNLDGYRFAKAVVVPCPPMRPLVVKACYGLRPICSTAPGAGCAAPTEASGPVEAVESLPPGVAPPLPESAGVSLPPVPEPVVEQPFTSP